jgi:hypothetical protein
VADRAGRRWPARSSASRPRSAIGGTGGAGGDGSTVTVTQTGTITTGSAAAPADLASGIFVQSIGGSGGNGGSSGAYAAGGNISTALAVGGGGVSGVTVGGNAGGASAYGGNGAAVSVCSNYSASCEGSGGITTYGQSAPAIFAQSIGGAGGNGGASQSNAAGTAYGVSGSVGGFGSEGGAGGAVSVSAGGSLATSGLLSPAIQAQSVGGGGGNGGSPNVTSGAGISGLSRSGSRQQRGSQRVPLILAKIGRVHRHGGYLDRAVIGAGDRGFRIHAIHARPELGGIPLHRHQLHAVGRRALGRRFGRNLHHVGRGMFRHHFTRARIPCHKFWIAVQFPHDRHQARHTRIVATDHFQASPVVPHLANDVIFDFGIPEWLRSGFRHHAIPPVTCQAPHSRHLYALTCRLSRRLARAAAIMSRATSWAILGLAKACFPAHGTVVPVGRVVGASRYAGGMCGSLEFGQKSA